MSEPRDEMLHHEYDGIREFDNPPPPWIMWTLYGSIVFAIGYWGYYHTFPVGRLPRDNYTLEVARAAEAQLARMSGQEVTDEALLLAAQVPSRVEGGHAIFTQFCVPCHLEDASGSVGPNLTDAYWLHGAGPMQIRNTVQHGVPEKGMVAWLPQLGPERVDQVVTYVLTLREKNLPGKAPQGVLVEIPSASSAASSAATPAAATASSP